MEIPGNLLLEQNGCLMGKRSRGDQAFPARTTGKWGALRSPPSWPLAPGLTIGKVADLTVDDNSGLAVDPFPRRKLRGCGVMGTEKFDPNEAGCFGAMYWEVANG